MHICDPCRSISNLHMQIFSTKTIMITAKELLVPPECLIINILHLLLLRGAIIQKFLDLARFLIIFLKAYYVLDILMWLI